MPRKANKGPPWALAGGPLWAGPLWAHGRLQAGPLWVGPLWAQLGPHGPGPSGPSWDTYICISIDIIESHRIALGRESANVDVKIVKTYTYSLPGSPADRPHPPHRAFIAASNGVQVASPGATPTALGLWGFMIGSSTNQQENI